jgi:hypothetical protein
VRANHGQPRRTPKAQVRQSRGRLALQPITVNHVNHAGHRNPRSGNHVSNHGYHGATDHGNHCPFRGRVPDVIRDRPVADAAGIS